VPLHAVEPPDAQQPQRPSGWRQAATARVTRVQERARVADQPRRLPHLEELPKISERLPALHDQPIRARHQPPDDPLPERRTVHQHGRRLAIEHRITNQPQALQHHQHRADLDAQRQDRIIGIPTTQTHQFPCGKPCGPVQLDIVDRIRQPSARPLVRGRVQRTYGTRPALISECVSQGRAKALHATRIKFGNDQNQPHNKDLEEAKNAEAATDWREKRMRYGLRGLRGLVVRMNAEAANSSLLLYPAQNMRPQKGEEIENGV
jgi:hypothetical protein